MKDFEQFLVKNGLYDSTTKKPLVRFAWCCDGGWDFKDFFV
jgi:3'-5' exoribonuclease 1